MKHEGSNEHWFEQLIDQYGDIYSTLKGIEIIVHPDGTYYLSSNYPERLKNQQNISLRLCKLYTNRNELMEALAIKSKGSFDNLTPLELLSRYKQGTIDISGSLEEGSYTWDLTFRIMRSDTYITNHDTDEQSVRHVSLLTISGITGYVGEYTAKHPRRLIATGSSNLSNS